MIDLMNLNINKHQSNDKRGNRFELYYFDILVFHSLPLLRKYRLVSLKLPWLNGLKMDNTFPI